MNINQRFMKSEVEHYEIFNRKKKMYSLISISMSLTKLDTLKIPPITKYLMLDKLEETSLNFLLSSKEITWS